jgi:hypothetical protein
MDSTTMKAQQKAARKLDRLLRAATGLAGYDLVEFFSWVRAQHRRRSALGALARDFGRKARASDVVAFVEQTNWTDASAVLQKACREYRERAT